MPVTVDLPAPYAPASAVLDLIERHRNRGLPAVVDADVLARAGISDSLIPRTLQTLKTLDLLTEDGRPSDVFERIRLAPTAEYEQSLTEWLKAAYADALSYVDPATDDEVAIRDAFRKYVPTGQQARMVTLFMGLFTAAGITPPKQPKQKSASRKTLSNGQVGRHRPKAKGGVVPPPALPVGKAHVASYSNLPAGLSGLMATLPPDGKGWTQEQRDKFMTAFPVMLDYSYPIISATDQELDDFDTLLDDNGD